MSKQRQTAFVRMLDDKEFNKVCSNLRYHCLMLRASLNQIDTELTRLEGLNVRDTRNASARTRTTIGNK
jgi:hypothetical protein